MLLNKKKQRKFLSVTLDSDHKVGIEIEIESDTVDRDMVWRTLCSCDSGWLLDDEEGSLRGGEYGWEIKTAGQGIPLKELRNRLNNVFPILAHSSGTWRAAVHVHVDARGLGNFASILGLAYALDRSVFSTYSPHRVESNFAVPLSNTPADVIAQMELFTRSKHNLVETMTKYRSVNFRAWQTFGTIEFRHMETPKTDATVSSVLSMIERIVSYATTCARIVQHGSSVPLGGLVNVIPRSSLECRQYYNLDGVPSPQDVLTVLQATTNAYSLASNIDHDLRSVYSAIGGDVHSLVVQGRRPALDLSGIFIDNMDEQEALDELLYGHEGE